MKLSTIAATLAELGARPTQSLGQNFLHDQNLAKWIVEQAGIEPGAPWVEIGPGLGALTEFAAEISPHGILLEKDDRMVPWLRKRFPKLEIVHGDALDFDPRDLFWRGPLPVFGNLPYYISSQLLFQFTEEPSPASRMVITLQRELAERLCAKPDTSEYGALTVLIGRRWNAKLLRHLPPQVFTPVPKVGSSVVVLTPREDGTLPECDGVLFRSLVKRGFSQRRKQLNKMLELDRWAEFSAKLGVPVTARAEDLSLAHWVTLTNLAGGSPDDHSGGAQDVNGEIFDVVDEQNNIIGQQPRGVVHREKLRHRAIHILVFNKRGELFLQRRSRWKDAHPRSWDSSAAGHVNAGDDYDTTAPRELQEELGVSAALEPIGEIAACANTGCEFVKIYRAQHEGPFRLPPAEIECGAFFSPAQIQRWMDARPQDFANGFIECWRTLATAGRISPGG
jgi:16S rRNA (adenine1518-N6/adenine1519-N6)-dimethyltransferase